MDEFAQTGAQQDDLFDDIQYAPGGGEEVEPIQTRAGDDLFADDIKAAAEPVVEKQQAPAPSPAPIVAQRGGSRGGRGRGGEGRGGRGRGGREQHQQRTKDQQQQVPAAEKTTQSQTPASEQKQDIADPASATTENAQSVAAAEPASTSASAPAPAPLSDSRYSTSDARPSNPARGDRRATGGLQKPKLSAAELEAKMQRMSLRSAELTERHARAEADRQSFDKREQVAKEVAKQRSKEERRDRQQMMGEREKNRLRKLKAVEGREWDMQKQEEDYDPRAAAAARGGSMRGAHGGIAGSRDASSSASGFGRDQEDYTDGREYLYRENRGRGRGGRGGGGASRGGRGGRGSFSGGDARQSAPPKHSDFPELPSAGTPSTGSAPAPTVSFPKKTKAEEAQPNEAGSQQQDIQTSSETKITAPIELPAPDAMAAAGGKRWADMVEG